MEEEKLKKGFFRRIGYSIAKLERYPNMAAEGFWKAMSYLTKIILIFAVVFSIGMTYQSYQIKQNGKINENSATQKLLAEVIEQNMSGDFTNEQAITMYISLFIAVCICAFIMYFIATIFNVLLISIFGYLTAIIAKIKMRYVAIFNLSVYSMTLSIFMQLIYIMLNMFIDFKMTYFQVAYVAIASVYLVAAIFIIKSDFIKKQKEITKIIEKQEELKQNKLDKEGENYEQEEQQQEK